MKRIIPLLLTGLCWMVSGTSNLSNAQRPSPSGCYQYTVKYVCGKGDGKILAFGYYYTAINILNANDSTVTYTKKVVSALPDRPGEATAPVSVSLKPGQAIEIDCPEIMEVVKYPPGTRSPVTKGFVVIQSNRPLDIVAVYTAGDLNKRVESIHTERVPANDQAGCPDLIVERIERPEWDQVGQRSVIQVIVKNIGCSTAPPTITRLVDPSTKQPNGTPFNATAPTPALAPGESVTLTFYLPYWVYNPDAELEATADYKNFIDECSESNNVKKFFELG